MTSPSRKIEVLSGLEPNRRWSTAKKLAMIKEAYEPEATFSIVARRYGIQPNQFFTWRKLVSQGDLTTTAAQKDVVPASEYHFLQNQVRELQRLPGRRRCSKRLLRSRPGQKTIYCARSRCQRETPDYGGVQDFECYSIQFGIALSSR